jgi:hypothetical protein
MKVVVVYESMFGNTHVIASAIGRGLEAAGEDVLVVPVHEADGPLLAGAELVVVGGPTHAHSMSRESTRASAAEMAAKDHTLILEEDADGEGLREWFETVARSGAKAAAFDTRISIPAVLSGRASKAINRQLQHHGFNVVADPESFLVTKENHLEPGEEARAEQWGGALAQRARDAALSPS